MQGFICYKSTIPVTEELHTIITGAYTCAGENNEIHFDWFSYLHKTEELKDGSVQISCFLTDFDEQFWAEMNDNKPVLSAKELSRMPLTDVHYICTTKEKGYEIPLEIVEFSVQDASGKYTLKG